MSCHVYDVAVSGVCNVIAVLQGVGRKQNLPPRLQRQQEQQKQQQQQQQQRPLSPQAGGPMPTQQQQAGAGMRQGPYPWPPYGGPQPWPGMPPMHHPMPWDMRMAGGRPPMDIPSGSGELNGLASSHSHNLPLVIRVLSDSHTLCALGILNASLL